jgi:hypothetical protein
MRWINLVACMVKAGNAYKTSVRKPEGKGKEITKKT